MHTSFLKHIEIIIKGLRLTQKKNPVAQPRPARPALFSARLGSARLGSTGVLYACIVGINHGRFLHYVWKVIS